MKNYRIESRKIVSQFVDITNKIVHHIDGNPQNNSLGNLIALTRKDHYKLHGTMGGWRIPKKKTKKITPKNLESLITLYNEGQFV